MDLRPLFLDEVVGKSLGSTEGEGAADEERVEERELLLECGEAQGTLLRPLFRDEGVGVSLGSTEGEEGVDEGRLRERKLFA